MPRVVNPLPQLVPQRVNRAKARVEALLWTRSEELVVQGGPVNPEPLALAAAKRQKFTAVRAGERFGPAKGGWQQRWFRVAVPAPRAGEKGLRHLRWSCEGEATAYLDGEPWAGFDPAHRTQLLPDRACTLWLDLGTYQTGIWCGAAPISPYGLRFDGCALAVRDPVAWGAWCDLDVLLQLLNAQLKREGIKGTDGFGYVPPHEACSPLTRRLLHGLDRAIDAFDQEGLPRLREALGALMASLPAESWQPVAALCGHAHIDLVWLWPEIETERKGVHTFATQLRLMERYPEYRFVQSQPALTRAIERRAPALAKQIRQRVKDGRWEFMGGFETEPDNQLPSGEALVRSLLIGQAKIAEYTGEPSRVCWLPDVFGYAACLPQILRGAGIDRFYTTKMTWSAVTRFPYTSFVWRGADGSEVLAHLCPTGYNGDVAIENGLIEPLRHHRQSGVHGETLLGTGYGDGGGGVTELMCERARRLGALAKPGRPAGLAGAPPVRWSTSAAFFDRLEVVRDELPVYQGELYLEYHRGTFTTQSEFKRLYRRAETALQAREAVRVVTGGKPLDEAAWRRIAFCQFHDAIPGSSIGLVYQQLNAELTTLGDGELAAAAKELAGKGGHLAVFNAAPLPRTLTVELPGGVRAWAADGAPVPTQAVGHGKAARTLALLRLPALGTALITAAEAPAAPRSATAPEAGPRVLDNGLVRAEFDAAGRLVGLREGGRELLLRGPAALRLYVDEPANFDAWDIDHAAVRSARDLPAMPLRLVEHGPVRAVLRGEAAVGARSHCTVDWILETGRRWLKVEVSVAWAEDHRLLRFHLPTGYAGRFARFGMPFGSIERPQQPGVERDEAMWEVPGSRWAAVVDDGGEGCAIVTEAKHGFSCRDGDLALSLLRSPTHPDPAADRGEHTLRFAIGRHRVRQEGDALPTAAVADALWAPVVVASGGRARPAPFLLQEQGTLVPSWVLPAEGGGFVLRLHETAGERGSAVLQLPNEPKAVDLVDLRGQVVGQARRLGRARYALDYAPYRIVSVRVR